LWPNLCGSVPHRGQNVVWSAIVDEVFIDNDVPPVEAIDASVGHDVAWKKPFIWVGVRLEMAVAPAVDAVDVLRDVQSRHGHSLPAWGPIASHVVRVVAGTHRGRRLVVPKGTDVRPTSDRAREATFNRLTSMDLIDGATVLDLFAGSGALGIEALSRGAQHVTFVDSDRRAIATIRDNLSSLGLDEVATVVPSPALGYVSAGRRHDLALLDPPYDFDGWDELLGVLPADVAMVESNRPIEAPDGWIELKSSKYGRAIIAVLERTERYRRN
jgi:16S rRNA (guanine966-N2)-methyltransferase